MVDASRGSYVQALREQSFLTKLLQAIYSASSVPTTEHNHSKLPLSTIPCLLSNPI